MSLENVIARVLHPSHGCFIGSSSRLPIGCRLIVLSTTFYYFISLQASVSRPAAAAAAAPAAKKGWDDDAWDLLND